MKLISLISMLMIAAVATSGELYKIVHQDGSVTYTDSPQAGAVKVELDQINSVTMPSLTSTTGQSQVNKQFKPAVQYQLSIVSPSKEETIRDNRGRMSVKAQMSPAASGLFELYLDGNMIRSSALPSFQLENVLRGEHSLQVKFVSNTGKILASSEPRVFFMHQNSVLINPN